MFIICKFAFTPMQTKQNVTIFNQIMTNHSRYCATCESYFPLYQVVVIQFSHKHVGFEKLIYH